MADRKRRRISSPHVPEPPPGTFSRAIQVGDELFVAGMTANSPGGAEGGAMNDIVKMTGFITDIKQREEYLRARRDYFSADPPASTLVEVTALAAPGLLIEVEVLAVVGSSHRSESAAPRPGKPPRVASGRRRAAPRGR